MIEIDIRENKILVVYKIFKKIKGRINNEER